MKSTRNKINAVPEIIVKKIFFRNVDYFKIEGEGEFQVNGNSHDIHISAHLSGKKDIHINPLSESGLSSCAVLDFIISEKQKHPFSNASLVGNELKKRGIPSHIEVTDGGKGYYHLWIFFDSPVSGLDAANALKRFAYEITGLEMGLHPDKMSDDFVPLPFQGESILFQRRVFVNSVGKMIKDQSGYLLNLDYCSFETASSFIDEFNILSEPELPEININTNEFKEKLPETPEIQKKSEEKEFPLKELSDLKKKRDSNQLSFDIALPVITEMNVPEVNTDIHNVSESINNLTDVDVKEENENPADDNRQDEKFKIPEKEIVTGDNKEFLIFNSGRGLSAIDAKCVEAIIDEVQIISYPWISETLGGIIKYKNNIIPVIPCSEFENIVNSKVVIIGNETGKFGIEISGIKGIFKGAISDNGAFVTENNVFSDMKTVEVMDLEKLSQKYSIIRNNGGSVTPKRLFIFEFSGFMFGIEINFISEIISYSGSNHSNSRLTYNGKKTPLLRPAVNSCNILNSQKMNSLIDKRILLLERDGIHTGILADSVSGLNPVSPEIEYIIPDCIKKNSFIDSFFQINDSDKIVFIINSENIFNNNQI